MSLTVSFDSDMEDELRSLAAKSRMAVEEYVVKVVFEAIEDARDYERCAAVIDRYEVDSVSFGQDEVLGSSDYVDPSTETHCRPVHEML